MLLARGAIEVVTAVVMSIKALFFKIPKNMQRKDLKEKDAVSQNVRARLSKNQAVTMETMEKICSVLQCDIGDVIKFIPDDID